MVYDEGASLATARQAVESLGGRIVTENTTVGVATVASSNVTFIADAAAQAALDGAARNVPVGYQAAAPAPKRDGATLTRCRPRGRCSGAARKVGATSATAEPLAGLQWDMAHDPRDRGGGSYDEAAGRPRRPGGDSRQRDRRDAIPTSPRTSTRPCRGTSSPTSRRSTARASTPVVSTPSTRTTTATARTSQAAWGPR